MQVNSYLRTYFTLILAKYHSKLKDMYFREFFDERLRRKPVLDGRRRLCPLGGRVDHKLLEVCFLDELLLWGK